MSSRRLLFDEKQSLLLRHPQGLRFQSPGRGGSFALDEPFLSLAGGAGIQHGQNNARHRTIEDCRSKFFVYTLIALTSSLIGGPHLFASTSSFSVGFHFFAVLQGLMASHLHYFISIQTANVAHYTY